MPHVPRRERAGYPPADHRGTLPSLEYAHGPGDVVGCAILGGYVYRGSLAPELSGRYLYADLCSGFVRSFVWAGAVADQVDLTSEVGAHAGVTSFGEDARGELYLIVGDGSVYRFESNERPNR